MTSNHRWRLLIILFIVGWASYELWPPKGRNLITDFDRLADFGARDTTFTNILKQARELEQKNPDRGFGNLKDAVGTNDLTRYFPFVTSAKDQKDPNAAVLNRLQRDAAGKIKLGLDLQGGTSFLVGMDTSRLNTDTNAANNLERRQLALSHAVEVLRKRVDKFGVAEPVIQQAGDDQILIQLPDRKSVV